MLPASDAEEVLRLLPEPAVIVTPRGDVVFANEPAERLLADGANGGRLMDRVHSAPDRFLDYLRQCSDARALLVGAVSLTRPDGAVTRMRVHGGLVRPGRGKEPPHVLLRLLPHERSEFSVLARTVRELNDEVRHRRRTYALLEEAVHEKDVLLRELHHRVNNNLQMLASMISIMRRDAAGLDANTVLDKIGGRLHALAILQRLMYHSAERPQVPGKKFVEDLTAAVVGSLAPNATVLVDAANLALPHETAVPLALILDELLLNAIKHGLRDGRGSIGVTLRSDARALELVVEDDGPGMPPMKPGPVRRSSGLEIVKGLCRQASAGCTVETCGGTRWTLRFPHSEGGGHDR